MSIDRRRFLRLGAGAAGALVLSFHLPAGRATEARGSHAAAGSFAPNAWLRIDTDGSVTVLVEKPELGQGSHTYVPMMIAEELEVDWSAIRVEQAPTIPSVYENLRTAGSAGVSSTFTPMRVAGAQARQMLLSAAASRWHSAEAECRAERGHIIHDATGRRASYGELIAEARKLHPPAADTIILKDPGKFRLIGRPLARLDIPGKISGSATFGIDVRLPRMLYAVIARCPHFHGRLASFDADKAAGMPGVRAVFEVPPLPRRINSAGGVAVVAESSWAAMQARKTLTLQWDSGAQGSESTDILRQRMRHRLEARAGFVAVRRGDALGALARSARTFEACYESPFQAHATMEPMNTTIHVRPREIEVWSPTQFADEIQREIAGLAGVPSTQVIVHMTLSGGSFGRRYQWDYAAEAWQVARNFDRPVQLLWTREDDMQHDFYRPYNLQRLRAGIDENGRILAWATRIVTTPISGTNLYTGHDETPEALSDPATVAALEWYGADVDPYSVPHFRLDYAAADSVVPRSWWRGVSSSYTLFAKECFIDELAHATGRDPVQYRLEQLRDSAPAGRLRAVLQLAAKSAGWGPSLPKRSGRGIACRADDTCCAMIAEVTVDAAGAVQVRRVVSAVDCGLVVNPDGVRAMTEGGVNFALTAVLKAQITVKEGAVQQGNFHDYRVLRLNEAPEVETYFVPSAKPPSGVGELAAMLIGPAVANAVFAATGVRVRRLPIDPRLLGEHRG
jgi:isoquinoline 1-oxidoreductase subunit beta